MKLLSNKLAILVGIIALTGGVALAAPAINQALGTWSDTFSDDDGLSTSENVELVEGSVLLESTNEFSYTDEGEFESLDWNSVTYTSGDEETPAGITLQQDEGGPVQ